MIKCDESCIPCCDYCIHAQYERQPIAGRIVTGCAKHEDDEHQKLARNLGYCEDFYCINSSENNVFWRSEKKMNYIKIESIDGTIRAINVDTIVYVQSRGDDMCEICHVSGGNSNVVVARRNIDSVLDAIDNIKHYEMMSRIN